MSKVAGIERSHKAIPWEAMYGPTLVGLLALFFVLGVRNTGGFSWTADEGIILMSATLLEQGYALYREIWFNYPPLFFVALAGAFRLFGTSAEVGRAVTVFFATLGLSAVALIVREVSGRLGALIAVVLLALAPPYWEASRAALLADLPATSVAALSVFYALRTMDAVGRRRYGWLALAGGALVTSVLIKPSPYSAVVPLLVVVCLAPQQSGRFRKLVDLALLAGSCLLTGGIILVAFDLPAFVSQMMVVYWGSTRVDGLDVCRNLRLLCDYAFGGYELRHYDWLVWVLGAMLSFRRISWRKDVIVLSWFVATVGALLTFAFLKAHLLVILLPPLAVLAGMSVARTLQSLRSMGIGSWQERAILLARVSVVGITLLLLPQNLRVNRTSIPYEGGRTEKARRAVEFLRQTTSPEDFLIADGDGLMVVFRAGRKVIPFLSNTSGMRVRVGSLTPELVVALAEQYRPRAILPWDKQLNRMPSFMAWVQAHYYVGRAYDERRKVYLRLDSIPYAQPADLGGQVRLLGFDLEPLSAEPGSNVRLILYWQALQEVDMHYTIFIHLIDRHGDRWGQVDALLLASEEYSGSWSAGDVVRDEHLLPISDNAPSGEYFFQVGMHALPEHQCLPAYGPGGVRWPGDAVRLARPILIGLPKERLYTVPTMHYRLEVHLGERICLLGYDLEQAAGSDGERFVLTLYWQALGRVQSDYKVFAHLLDAEGRIVAQHDGVPGEGFHPTSGWVAGEVIADRHAIQGDPQVLQRGCMLAVGMYDPQTIQRLAAFDEQGQRLPDDRILLSLKMKRGSR